MSTRLVSYSCNAHLSHQSVSYDLMTFSPVPFEYLGEANAKHLLRAYGRGGGGIIIPSEFIRQLLHKSGSNAYCGFHIEGNSRVSMDASLLSQMPQMRPLLLSRMNSVSGIYIFLDVRQRVPLVK